jgi:phytoene dehydrogenase-like protein
LGWNYIYPDVDAAHPLDNGTAAVLKGSVADTAQLLGGDERRVHELMTWVTEAWPQIDSDVLGPLHFPKHPFNNGRLRAEGLAAGYLFGKGFKTTEARAYAGRHGGAFYATANPCYATSAIALVLMAAGHLGGWPIPQGGSHSIANALAAYFTSIGGKIETGVYVKVVNAAAIRTRGAV